MSESKVKVVSHTIGRRKEAIASIRLLSGKTEITVNGKPISVYFPGSVAKTRYEKPFQVTGLENKYTASVKVHGGGYTGQLDAVVLGISRALAKIKSDLKKPLRTAGLLTRDSRVRQRRMVGTGGKARRRKQSPKR